ncbi:MAG: HAMP domain-containing protein, partial [Bdellovibrionia bacterium]
MKTPLPPSASSTGTLDTTRLLQVLTALKKGDFTARMPVEDIGIAGKISDTLNELIEWNETLVEEVARANQVIGKDGNTTHRMPAALARGGWSHLVENFNDLIGYLVQPNDDMARVIGAFAKGNLSETMVFETSTGALKGNFLKTATAVNAMIKQLGLFASEVTRVAREVGTDGKLGGQAKVEGAAGIWKDLTDTVNAMAGNLTVQLRDVSKVATAIANGDLGQKITVDVKGEILQIKDVINKLVDQLSSFASEVSRVAIEVGTEGKLGGQARVEGVAGMWNDLTDNVNQMVGNLTVQLRDVSKVATAIANGDLGQKITVDVKGEILQIKDVINRMVDQLGSFASEVTRVSREVGTEGKLGGQAVVKDVAGTWKDLTDTVNAMAGNLTVQLRDVSKVATAIANGDLGQKITVDVKGEILQIKDVINKLVDQLSSFASEVSRVAIEVGTEGKLGG